MLVHFIGSRATIDEDISYFRRIVDILKANNCELTRPWVEEAYRESQEGEVRDDWRRITQTNIEALARADIAIAEASSKSFSIGFQVANAIQQKKPLLILTRNQSLEDSFGSGISSDFVQFADYNDENLEDIIIAFIRNNTIDNKDLRFNFFIDRKIYNYLRWASFKTGKTKAEILRDLVKKDIEREDF